MSDQPQPQNVVYVNQPAGSVKSKGVAIALAFFFGWIGIHHFYLDRPLIGILCVFFCWTGIPLLVSLLEVLVMLLTSDRAWRAKFA